MIKRKALFSFSKHFVLAVGAFTMVFPFYWEFSTSLRSMRNIFQDPFALFPTHPTFQNYVALFSQIPFARYVFNSFVVASLTTLLQVMTAVLSAYAFARMEFKGRKWIFYVVLATIMIPSQLIMIPQYLVIAKFGWVNTYQALILPYASTAVSTFFLRQFFLTIPRDLEDAAIIDGCSRLQILLKVILPLSKSAISTIAVFSFMWSWNSYFWPLLVVNEPQMRTIQLGLAIFRTQGGFQWGEFMAGTVVATVPILIFYFLAQRRFVRSITLTGLKG